MGLGSSKSWVAVVCLAVLVVLMGVGAPAQQADAQESKHVGIFEGSGDVGKVLHPGSVELDASKGTYTIAGSGENMWFASDEFQFVWKKLSGDGTLTADIAFVGAGKNEHRKAVLMVRQNLEGDSVYADVAVHGSGLTSLQYRDDRGATTREVQANVNAPKRVRIEKHGDYFTMWLAGADGKFVLAGATGKIVLTEPYYVGIGVCSHDKDVVEKAVFSNVELKGSTAAASAAKPTLYSMMEIIDAESLDRRAIYVAPERFEAPNWMPDGKRLLFNRKGRIETIPVGGGATQVLDTGFAVQCNNDHGISPDAKQLVISDNSQLEHESRVYLLPIGGGKPKQMTKNAPSYWHGWSPDGKTLAFVGERNGDFDIYTIPVTGGEEARLTTAKGLDDGPEYTPDGKWIYFNSVRTGHMQIWKMRPDGSEQTQVTMDEYNNWFPHFSPDGTQMVFITFDRSVEGHPENKDVMLRIMSMKDGKMTVAAKLFGGQGTINVPSWSPDGKKFAFVSYALVPQRSE
jgi:TolB protein